MEEAEPDTVAVALDELVALALLDDDVDAVAELVAVADAVTTDADELVAEPVAVALVDDVAEPVDELVAVAEPVAVAVAEPVDDSVGTAVQFTWPAVEL